jgi:uncharacterized membrane protein (DUF106 family)
MTIDTKDKLVELLQAVILFGIALTLLYGCTSDEEKAKQVQVQAKASAEEARAIACRAKFANYLMRFEELSKPEKERWEAFYGYMGDGCMK